MKKKYKLNIVSKEDEAVQGTLIIDTELTEEELSYFESKTKFLFMYHNK